MKIRRLTYFNVKWKPADNNEKEPRSYQDWCEAINRLSYFHWHGADDILDMKEISA